MSNLFLPFFLRTVGGLSNTSNGNTGKIWSLSGFGIWTLFLLCIWFWSKWKLETALTTSFLHCVSLANVGFLQQSFVCSAPVGELVDAHGSAWLRLKLAHRLL